MEEIIQTMKSMQNLIKTFSEQEQQLKKTEKRNLELISDLEKRGKESSEQKRQLISFQGIIENLQETNAKLQSKLDEDIIKHLNDVQQTKKENEELNSELQDGKNSKEECQETLDKLQIQFEREVTKCSKLRTDLLEAQKTIEGQEEKLVEAERIIRDQQKAIQETEEKLKKAKQFNVILAKKSMNLEKEIKRSKIEIERLEGCLSDETQEKTNIHVKYQQLREFLFSLNAEFSVFIENLSTSQQSEGDGEKEDDNSAQVKLAILSTRVKNKFIAWAENQKMMKGELTKTQQVVILLNQLVDQLLGQKLQANKDVTDLTYFSVAVENTTTVKSYRDIARQSTLPEVHVNNPTNVSKIPQTFVFNSQNYIQCPRLSSSIPSSGKQPVQAILSKRHRRFPKKRQRCIHCGKPFSSWKKLYHHKWTVHSIQKSKKVLQHHGRSQTRNWKKEKNPPPSKTKMDSSTIMTSPEPIITGDGNEDQQQRSPIPFSEIVVEGTSTPNATPEFTILTAPKSEQNETTTSAEPTISGTSALSQTSNIVGPQENVSIGNTKDGRKSHEVDLSKNSLGFYCICGQKLTTKSSLTAHVEYFMQEWKFQCEMCDQRFLYLYRLKKHYADSHKMPKYLKQFRVGCIECGIMFATRKKFNFHRKDVHQALSFREKAENLVISSSTTKMKLPFINRERIDENDVLVNKADLAQSKASSQIELRSRAKSNGRHLRMISHPSPELSPIPSIPTPASSPPTLVSVKMEPAKDPLSHKTDWSKQKSAKQFSCIVCGCMFKFTSHLRKHMQKVHDMTCEVTGCRQCGQLFHNIEELNDHKSNDHPRKKWKRKAEKADQTNNVRTDDDKPSTSSPPVKKTLIQRTNLTLPVKETILTPLTPGNNPLPSPQAYPAPFPRCTDSPAPPRVINPSTASRHAYPALLPRDNGPPKTQRETVPTQPQSREIDPSPLKLSSTPTAAQILACHSSKVIQSSMTMTSCDVPSKPAKTKTLNLHGIDLNKSWDEYFCKCGTQFPDALALGKHILNHVGTSLTIASEQARPHELQNMISVNGNQNMISTDGPQNTISANGNQSMISAYGHQNKIRPHGHQNIIRSISHQDTSYQSGLLPHRQQSIVRSHMHSVTNTSHHETSVDISRGPENGTHVTKRPDVHQGTATTTTGGVDEYSPVTGLRRMSIDTAPQSDQTTPLPPVRPSVAGQTGTSLSNSALLPVQSQFSLPVYYYYCSTNQCQ